MTTHAPATPTPLPYGGPPYHTPIETLEWTAPSWYDPIIPIPRSVAPTGATELVPVISMMPIHKGPGLYVRAFDNMPEEGYPLLVPSNPPLPLDVLGSGLAPPQSPAPGESEWDIYPQYSSMLRPITENEAPAVSRAKHTNRIRNEYRSDM